MRDGTRTDVTVYDTVVTATPISAPQKPLKYFLDKITEAFDPKDLTKTVKWIDRKKTKLICLRDVKVDPENKWVCLLLYFADKNGMGASFTDVESYLQEDIILEGSKARPASAHVLISTKASDDGSYLSIIEDSSKLTRSNIQSYIRYLMKEISSANPDDFKAPHESGELDKNGKPKQYKYKNSIELQGHPSDDLIKCIKDEGKLLGLTLERNNHFKSATGEGYYVLPKKEELHLKPTTGKWYEDAMDRLKEAANLGKQDNYEAIRIVFNAKDGRSHTARLNTTTMKVLGDRFVKRHRIKDFTIPLNEADSKVNQQIHKGMLSILKA